MRTLSPFLLYLLGTSPEECLLLESVGLINMPVCLIKNIQGLDSWYTNASATHWQKITNVIITQNTIQVDFHGRDKLIFSFLPSGRVKRVRGDLNVSYEYWGNGQVKRESHPTKHVVYHQNGQIDNIQYLTFISRYIYDQDNRLQKITRSTGDEIYSYPGPLKVESRSSYLSRVVSFDEKLRWTNDEFSNGTGKNRTFNDILNSVTHISWGNTGSQRAEHCDYNHKGYLLRRTVDSVRKISRMYSLNYYLDSEIGVSGNILHFKYHNGHLIEITDTSNSSVMAVIPKF